VEKRDKHDLCVKESLCVCVYLFVKIKGKCPVCACEIVCVRESVCVRERERESLWRKETNMTCVCVCVFVRGD